MLICNYCNKECKNKNSYSNHTRLCPKNPNRVYKNGMEGKVPWNKGLTKDDPRVLKNAQSASESLKGKPGRKWTDEQRKAKSEWRKQYHIDNPDAHPNRKLANNRIKMSYPEKVAYDWLTTNGIEFKHQEPVGGYYPDFVIGNMILEIDGEYWHSKDADAKKDEFFKSLGYEVFRIKAKEFIEGKLKSIFGV